MTDDALIIGAGIMGCATALALADRGVRTTVLEKSVPGAEASSAAAGILGAQAEAHADGPMARLCLASRALYPGFVEALRERTGIDVAYRKTGILHAAFDADALAAIEAGVAWQRAAGLAVETLDARAVREREPGLGPAVAGAIGFPDDARLDPPTLLRALRIAADRAGAVFRSGVTVRAIDLEPATASSPAAARGAILEDGSRLRAGHVVLAAGSWSTQVAGAPLAPDAVRPARGQMVELQTPVPLVRSVVYGPTAYLSPRDDGRVLVGSTLEFVGFRPGVTAAAVRDLLAGAIDLVPALAEATLSRTWSSFRPHTPDELPLLGRTRVDRLLLATGHFRNGILLAPITAEIVAALVAGAPPPFDPSPFAADRRASSA